MLTRISYPLLFLFVLLAACKNHRQATAYTPPATSQVPAQTSTNTGKSVSVPNDMQVIVTEEMLNKCFKALGPIVGREPYELWFVKDTFTWVLINPMIHLHSGKADFTTQVSVMAGKLAYTTDCVGDVSIWYDRPKNLINVKITKCVVEIYTKFLGKKYHIKDIDLASQFPDPFTFEGPTATSSSMDMEMPDGTIRTLYMTTTDCDLTVEEKRIVVPCEVDFTRTPPKPPAPVQRK